MAEAITLNIGNGAATLTYNEIVYSKIYAGSGSAYTDDCSLYTWQIMLVINPMSAGPAFILPYQAWHQLDTNANLQINYYKEGNTSAYELFTLNDNGYAQGMGNQSILLLLN